MSATAASKPASRQDLINQRDEAAAQFIKNLEVLINIIKMKSRKDVDIEDIESNFIKAKQVPDEFIQKIGPYVWEYRENIAKQDSNFILITNFDDKIEHISAKAGNTDVDKISHFKQIIGKIRNIWRSTNDNEKAVLWRHLQNLNSYFASFVHIHKQIENNY